MHFWVDRCSTSVARYLIRTHRGAENYDQKELEGVLGLRICRPGELNALTYLSCDVRYFPREPSFVSFRLLA